MVGRLPKLKHLAQAAKQPDAAPAAAQVAAPKPPEPTVVAPRSTAVSVADIQASVSAIDWSAPRLEIADRLRTYAALLTAEDTDYDEDGRRIVDEPIPPAPRPPPTVLQPAPAARLAPPPYLAPRSGPRPFASMMSAAGKPVSPPPSRWAKPNATDARGRPVYDLNPDDIPFD